MPYLLTIFRALYVPHKCCTSERFESKGFQRLALKVALVLSRVMCNAPGDMAHIPQSDGYSQVLKRYDDLSYRQFLLRKGWSEAEIELFSATSGSESLLNIGAPEVFSEDAARVWDDKSV